MKTRAGRHAASSLPAARAAPRPALLLTELYTAARRDRALGRLGYRVLRLDAELVLRELPVALARIRAALEDDGR